MYILKKCIRQFSRSNLTLITLMDAIPLCDKIEVYIYIYFYLFIYLRVYTTICRNSE